MLIVQYKWNNCFSKKKNKFEKDETGCIGGKNTNMSHKNLGEEFISARMK